MQDDFSQVCGEFQSMLEEAIPLVSDRKLRLFCCACCRRFWGRLDAYSRHLVELTESYCDEEVSVQEIRDVRASIRKEHGSVGRACLWATAILEDWTCERAEGWKGHVLGCVIELLQKQTWYRTVNAFPPTWEYLSREMAQSEANKEDDFASLVKAELRHQMLLAQDIFGELDRGSRASLLLPYLWKLNTITTVATTIYQSRRFSDLPLLADALEEVGYIESSVLLHCRAPIEHVRGCWVLDLLLGKH